MNMRFYSPISSAIQFFCLTKSEKIIEQEERRNGGEKRPKNQVSLKEKFSRLPPFLRSSCSILPFYFFHALSRSEFTA